MIIHLLYGVCGEYDDREIWNVRAYKNKKDANNEKMRLNDLLDKLGALAGEAKFNYSESSGMGGTTRTQVMETMRKEDKQFRVDYTGSEYFIDAIRLI